MNTDIRLTRWVVAAVVAIVIVFALIVLYTGVLDALFSGFLDLLG